MEAATTEPLSPAVVLPREARVVIVGAGFSGLGMAIRLAQAGIDDFVVLERAEDVGGTWRDNTYPGCACDVPSHLYSFSFAMNPGWSRTFSGQAEIWDYLRRCADEHGVTERVRFGHEMLDASWDETDQRWTVETSRGAIRARFLVMSTGGLSEPSVPNLPGLEDFEGKVFHSAAWDHDHDLSGERVAVVGTGASAIQFLPQIQPEVSSLHLFQRTAPWVMPRPDRDVTALERWVYRRLPAAQRAMRGAIYAGREAIVPMLMGNRTLGRIVAGRARQHIHAQVPDPGLRRKVTPDYAVGCKRILSSNDYYPALAQPNVEVVTEGITRVGPRSVIAAAGTEREVDTIIFGTGFHVTDWPVSAHVRGRGGTSLAELWRGSPRAHRGTTVAGFPNLFLLTGPNTGLGHNSIVYMIESQLSYILDALRVVDERGAAGVEVLPGAQTAYNDDVQRRMEGTVWTSGGCASWYLDASGRNATLWPGHTWRFRRLTRRFDAASYRLLAPAPERMPLAA